VDAKEIAAQLIEAAELLEREVAVLEECFAETQFLGDRRHLPRRITGC
jgi:hypothetical protein